MVVDRRPFVILRTLERRVWRRDNLRRALWRRQHDDRRRRDPQSNGGSGFSFRDARPSTGPMQSPLHLRDLQGRYLRSDAMVRVEGLLRGQVRGPLKTSPLPVAVSHALT